MRKIFAIALMMTLACAAHATQAPTGLLCNLLAHPEKTVITDPRPSLGWIVNSDIQDDVQTSCQILVASTKEAIALGRGDLWDSGKVASAQSINVAYQGKALEPDHAYWWAVRTWNKNGAPSPYSAAQRFNTGTFAKTDRRWPGESRWVRMPDEGGAPRWTLEDRHPIAYHEVAAVKTIKKADGNYFLDFGRAAFATIKLTVAWQPRAGQPREAQLGINVGEKRKGDGIDPKPGGGVIFRKYQLAITPGRREYTLQLPRWIPHYPQSQPLPAHMPEVIPFRYCEVLAGALGATIETPIQLALYYEFDDAAADFTCASPDLKKIYELCKYSVKANTFNGDYAASERERMLYEADTYIHQLSHYGVDREFAIARYSVENMIYHASWPTEWISHVILMAWADTMQTGDTRLIERNYEELKPKTMLALAGPDGLISTRTGGQTPEFLKSIHLGGKLKDIVDWPTGEADGYDFQDYNTVVNAYHYRSLVLMGDIAATLKKTEDAAFYRERAARVKAAINDKMFDRKRGLYVDGVGTTHASLHANMFPLAFGLVPEEYRKGVVEFVKSKKMACSVYPANTLLEALYDAGEDKAALALLLEPGDRGWLNMLRVGSTITTEAWDIKYKANSGWTHAWSASPAHILPRKLVGIEPLEPGFGKVKIVPRPGGLKAATAKLPTIRGTIEAGFEQAEGKSFVIKVKLPVNVTARVELPALGGTAEEVTLDGKKIKGKLGNGRVIVEGVGSGAHRIERSVP